MLLVGLQLIAADLKLFGASQAVQMLDLERLWPILLIFAGLALLAQYALEARKRGGLIFLGLLLMLSGSFFCMFTFQIGRLQWTNMAAYWPIFPLILGAGFLVLFLAEGLRDQSVLRAALLIGGIGLFALPITMGVIGGPVFDQAVRLWPLLIVLIILAIILQFRARGQGPDEDIR